MRKVLFHRNFKAFSGGHLKVWHHYNHVKASSRFAPYIYFSKNSVWNQTNPWIDVRDEVLPTWEAITPDILFLAGFDWRILSEKECLDSPVPIINFIQHVRHGYPDNPRYQFLGNKAIRICCSYEVKESLDRTKRVNGPTFVFPYGLDTSAFPRPLDRLERNCDVLILAIKNRTLGQEIYDLIKESKRCVDLLLKPIPRFEFLQRVSRARAMICIPNSSEGFYIPALEGMALETVVICPDCVGNRSFCIDGHNCLRPKFDSPSILEAANAVFEMAPSRVTQMLANAKATAAKHDLLTERKRFLNLLDHINDIW